jgi:hypothetical protein
MGNLSSIRAQRRTKQTRRRRAALSLEHLEGRVVLTVTLLPTTDSNVGLGFVDNAPVNNQPPSPTVDTPPDTSAAAGPDGPNSVIVEATNASIDLFDKVMGARLQSPASLQNFFTTAPRGTGVSPVLGPYAPVVAFDDMSTGGTGGQFVVGALEFDLASNPADPSYSQFDLAVSTSPNPATLTTADWNFYSYPLTATLTGGPPFADHPRIGWNADAYVVSFNLYNSMTSFNEFPNSGFVKAETLAIDKSNLTSTFQQDVTGGPFFSLVPAVMHDAAPGTPMVLVGTTYREATQQPPNRANWQDVTVVSMGDMNSSFLTSTPPVFTPYTVSIPDPADNRYARPGTEAKQKGGRWIAGNLDNSILNAAWRTAPDASGNMVDQLVASQTVRSVDNGADGDETRARWYDIDTTGLTSPQPGPVIPPALIQSGDVGKGIDKNADVYTYNPSVEIDDQGDIGMTFMESSRTDFLSMYVTGRIPTDPLGTMEELVRPPDAVGQQAYSDTAENQGPFHGYRIGDYSSISVDESTGTFWAANEIAVASPVSPNWGTRIENFTLSTNAAAGGATQLIVTAPTEVDEGTPFQITVQATDDFGDVDTTFTDKVRFEPSVEVLSGQTYTFKPSDHGVHTFTAIYHVDCAQSITVDDLTDTSISSGTADLTVYRVINVTNTNDSGPGSLREAIQDVNTSVDCYKLKFAIPYPAPQPGQPLPVQTISLLSALPAITNSVVIDGYTELGAQPNSLAAGDDATLLIAIDGSNVALGSDGLTISAGSSAVRGLIIENFSADANGNGGNGIVLNTNGGDVVEGDFIGTDGSNALGNGGNGVSIQAGADDSTVGGTTAAARNVISDNGASGIIIGLNVTGSLVEDNYIGTDSTGLTALGNFGNGISIFGRGNTVGGATTAYLNLISGNFGDGVAIAGASATGNLVQGSDIGTDVTGTTSTDPSGGPLGNFGNGVSISALASYNTVGGLAGAAPDVISGNGIDGVAISGIGTTGNVVQGSFIGTDANGITTTDPLGAPLGNGRNGVSISGGATLNAIGGSGSGNVISGNINDGVHIMDPNTTGNTVQDNAIGTDVAGVTALGNGNIGVELTSTTNNSLLGNTISANQNGGVVIDPGASENVLQGNFIGTDGTGTTSTDANGSPLGNKGDGVSISAGARNNTVGGLGAAARNIISGNTGNGVALADGGTERNVVEGNFIGTDASGTQATDAGGNSLGNGADGVNISGGATDNSILNNVISGNQNQGVDLVGSQTTRNAVQGNFIGTDVSGTQSTDDSGNSLGNADNGIYISGAVNNRIGGTAVGNVISNNGKDGILITGDPSTTTIQGTLIQGNKIGTDVHGALALPNASDGIEVVDSSNNTIGGLTPGTRNLISGNAQEGISLSGSSTTGTLIEGNYIGTNAAGTAALGNAGNGISVADSAMSNLIGGATLTPGTGPGNLIAGNFGDGINISAGQTSVQGNSVGLGTLGNPLGNQGDGVDVIDGDNTTIGGALSADRNVISANIQDGIFVNTSNTVVQGNFIGTDVTGTRRRNTRGQFLGNHGNGITVSGADQVTIGGTVAAAGNVISANSGAGVSIESDASQITLWNNKIGTDVSGATALPNGNGGVAISSSADNTIGGMSAGQGNLVSGNFGDGITIASFSTGNVVQGNKVGTDLLGTTALPNYGYGVAIDVSSSDNAIGGTGTSRRPLIAQPGNLISSNLSGGVLIANGSTANTVQDNFIGTDISGSTSVDLHGNTLGNRGNGVSINAAGADNAVGGLTLGQSNLISGNWGDGVNISGGAGANTLEGNFIGTDVTGTTCTDANGQPLGNRANGVNVNASASNQIGGLNAGAGNLISGNGADGIVLAGAGTRGNLVQDDFIGTDITGTTSTDSHGHTLGNLLDGVGISVAVNNVIGGTNALARNVIAGNGGNGVSLAGAGTRGNQIQGNVIRSNHQNGVSLSAASNNVIGGSVNGAGNRIASNAADGVRFDVGSFANGVQGNNILTNGMNGVHVLGASRNNTIGGVTAGSGNTIASNGHDGVLVDTGTGNAIRQNSISSHNGGLGIELRNNGNHGQPPPVLSSARNVGGHTIVVGSLTSTPLTTFVLEFFANSPNDPSEGLVFVGSVVVTTNVNGFATFTFMANVPVAPGQFITATATDPPGNTSQFSQSILVR